MDKKEQGPLCSQQKLLYIGDGDGLECKEIDQKCLMSTTYAACLLSNVNRSLSAKKRSLVS